MLCKRYSPYFVWGQLSNWFKQVRGGALQSPVCLQEGGGGCWAGGQGCWWGMAVTLHMRARHQVQPTRVPRMHRIVPHVRYIIPHVYRIVPHMYRTRVLPTCVPHTQTLYDPATSLSTERRGTLVLPDIEAVYGPTRGAGSKYTAKVGKVVQESGEGSMVEGGDGGVL